MLFSWNYIELDEILKQGENNQDSAFSSINVYIKLVSDVQGIFFFNFLMIKFE